MKKLTAEEFASLLKSRCVAITGGIATGKSTVAGILRSLQYEVIDADHLARDAVRPGTKTLQAITGIFGSAILTPAGHLDREKIRSIVMSDPAERKKLEAIMHPAIQKLFQERVEQSPLSDGQTLFFYEAALIFETGRQDLFHEVWATYCPEETQIRRLCDRSGLSRADALKILAAQMPALEKATKATRTIPTNGTLEDVKRLVEDSIKKLVPRHV